MLPRVACITVFFNPNELSIEMVRRLAAAQYPVIVVVNQAEPSQIAPLGVLPNLHLIQNLSNLGLARALNQGLGFAFDELNVPYAIAFDQDSTPDPSLPDALADELSADHSGQAACIGPILVDRKSANVQYAYDQKPHNLRSPRTIPTSGTLFTRDAWRSVGPMLEPLFIDGIDHEWCFRAYGRGMRVAVSNRVTMLHDMGDTGLRVFGRFKPIHRSPIRHYFIIRNTLYLCSLAYVPTGWKLSELLKTIRRIAVYLLVSTDRTRSLRMMCRAIGDGLRGRLGPCPIQ